MHTLAFFPSTTSDELSNPGPQGNEKFPHPALIKCSGLAEENIGGLENCTRVICSAKEPFSRVGCNEKLTSRPGLKQETGVVIALLARNLVGIEVGIGEDTSTKFLDRSLALTIRESSQDCTLLKFVILLVPFHKRLLRQ